MYILWKTSPLVQHPKIVAVGKSWKDSSYHALWRVISGSFPKPPGFLWVQQHHLQLFTVGLDGTFSVEVESGHLAETRWILTGQDYCFGVINNLQGYWDAQSPGIYIYKYARNWIQEVKLLPQTPRDLVQDSASGRSLYVLQRHTKKTPLQLDWSHGRI